MTPTPSPRSSASLAKKPLSKKSPLAKARARPARAKRTAASERNAGISSDAVLAKTGKNWKAWFAILDAARATKLPHKEIARWLHAEHAVPAWWSQMITVGYEQARGLRAKHETANGFITNASRTIAAPLVDVWRAWTNARSRAKWLGKLTFEIRRSTPEKSLRINWPDDTSVEVLFYSKGKAKSLVTIEHRKLDGARGVALSKKLWGGALERLKAQLEA